MAAIISIPAGNGPNARSVPVTFYLVRSAVVASLGGLLFGFETAVISGTTEWLRAHFGLSDFMLGLTVSSSLIGTLVGAVTVAKPADTYGRRGILFVLAGLFFFASLGCALAWNLESFLFFRLMGGVAVG